MAFELSERALNALNQLNIGAQIILEVEGLSVIFGASDITITPRFDETYEFDDGLFWDELVALDNSRDLISLQETTRRVTQQVQEDKADASSASSVIVNIVDKNNEISGLLAIDGDLPDPLSVKAKLYYSLQGTSHPEDSIPIFTGVISDLEFGPANVKITVSHPEQLKRQDVFIQATSPLTSGIGAGDTTIPIESASDYLTPADALSTYVRINDEIIQYTGTTTTSLTGASRGALGTTAAAHALGDDVVTFYRLQGQPIDLALKVMLSLGSSKENNDLDVVQFVKIDNGNTVFNAVQTTNFIAADQFGITIGDFITVSGATNGANNFSNRTVTDIVVNTIGTYFVVDGAALVEDTDQTATASFTSQYDVLPDGLGMTMDQVDVARHQEFDSLFSNNFIDLDIYLKDTAKGKELVNKDIYFPSGMYSIPRKSRSSLNMTIPPLSTEKIIQIDNTNCLNPEKLTISRSINEKFYNTIIFKFEEDALEDTFRKGDVTISADSLNQIKNVGARPLTVEAKGFRDTGNVDNTINVAARRFLDRYQFSAEQVKSIEVNLKTGYAIEVGDAVIFDKPSLKIFDNAKKSRSGRPTIMECTNKALDIGGRVRIDLTDTAFGIDARFGVVSPSSFVASGSTTTKIRIKNSFRDTTTPEIRKWEDLIGQSLSVHNEDFSTEYTTVLQQIDPTRTDTLVVDPPLGAIPPEDYVVDIGEYDDTDADTDSTLKDLFVFFTPQLTVVSGTSDTVFDVSASDAAKMFVGSIIQINKPDFSIITNEVKVTNISTTTITVDPALVNDATEASFTPASGDIIELVGFLDEGLPYRLF